MILEGGTGGKLNNYDVLVKGTKVGESAGGTPCIEIEFVTLDGSGTIMAWKYLTEKAWPYTEENLKDLGWDAAERGYNFEELNTDDQSPLAGVACRIAVEQEEYQGKTKHRVKFINRAGSGRATLDDTQVSGTLDAFRKKIGVTKRAVAGGVKVAYAAGTEKPVNESDLNIPF